MDPVIDQIFCRYCYHFGPKKYHNSTVPYCAECNTDIYGHLVGTCGWCGLVKQDITEGEQCGECFRQDMREGLSGAS